MDSLKPSVKIFFPKFLCQALCHTTKKVTNILLTTWAFSKTKKPTNRSHLDSGTKMILLDQITEERQEKVMADGYNKFICYMQA